MNFTARVWRASLFCSALILVSGCVSTRSGTSDVPGTPEGATQVSEQSNTQGGEQLPSQVSASDAVSTESPSEALVPAAIGASSSDDLAKAASEEIATQQVSRPRVNGVKIESASEGGNMVVADMSATAEFGLKRTAPSEYVLTLKGASIDPVAMTTLLAPAASGMVRSVRPVVRGDDVVLRVFVSPESSISARVEGNRIILGQFHRADEMMAQLAPDKVKPAAKEIVAKDGKEKTEKVKTPEVNVAAAAGAEPKPEVTASRDEPAAIDASNVASILDESARYSGRLISLDLQDTDIDNALRIIAEVSNLNIIASEDVTGKITLRLIDVPWDQALDVILKTNGLDKVQEGNVVRIAPVEKLRQEREALKQAQIAEQELEPLKVDYIRISYAKASELKPLVESVMTERGSVAYDERTNQLIVKDIRSGLQNVVKLVQKLDLRTPQILLETQIVEAVRGLTRDLGSQFGFNMIKSPETGNATGKNFPNSIALGGGGAGGSASSFPVTGGASVALALGSADGTINMDMVLSALEQEGRGRVVSRPSVATTNNKLATIKSVKKIRIKMPSGGTSVATGQGATSSGAQTATETVEAGITLDVTPQASPDYYVLMDLKAKSSTLDWTHQVEGIPTEVERSANSTVLVSSGQTFALGGIYKITDDSSVEGVPFLKDVPVLGVLFRRSIVTNGDEELIFFVTPRIIEGSFDDAAMRSAS